MKQSARGSIEAAVDDRHEHWIRWTALTFFRNLFAEKRDQFGVHPSEGCVESTFTVELADGGLDPCWVAECAEEIVRGEAGKPFAIHGVAFSQHILSGKQGEDGVADPCGFAFVAEFFVLAAHVGRMHESSGLARFFRCARDQFFRGVGFPRRHPSTQAAVQ